MMILYLHHHRLMLFFICYVFILYLLVGVFRIVLGGGLGVILILLFVWYLHRKGWV